LVSNNHRRHAVVICWGSGKPSLYKIMHHWQAHHFTMLDGEQATDEEFGMVMAKLE